MSHKAGLTCQDLLVSDGLGTEINELVEQHGLWKVVSFPIVFVVMVSGFAALLPNPIGWIAAGLTVVLVLLIVIGSNEKRIGDLRKGLENYSRALESVRAALTEYEEGRRLVEFETWSDSWEIDASGNATATRQLKVRAAGNIPVRRVEFTVSGPDLSKQEQQRFQSRTRVRDSEGHASLPITFKWESAARVVIWVFLLNPLAVGDTAEIEIVYTWPRQFVGFKTRQVETVSWAVKRPIDDLKYRLVLDKGLKRKSPLGVGLTTLTTQPTQTADGARWVIEGAGSALQADQKYSLRLDPTFGSEH